MSIVSGSQELSRRLVSELVRDSDGDWEPGAWAGCRDGMKCLWSLRLQPAPV